MAVMKLRVQLIIESDSVETEVVQEVATLERHSISVIAVERYCFIMADSCFQ
jgi:hypothetical protein